MKHLVEKKMDSKKVLPKNSVSKKPVAKKSAPKKPVAKKSVAKKPVAKKPVSKKPVSKKPVSKKPVSKKPVSKKPVSEKKGHKEVKLVKIDKGKLDVFLKSQEKKKKTVETYKKKKTKDPSHINKEMQSQIRFRNSITKEMHKEKTHLDKESTNSLFTKLVKSMICIRDVLEKGPVVANKDRKEVVTCLIRIHSIEEQLKKRKVGKIYKEEKPYIKEACKQIKLFYSVLEKSEHKS